MKSRCLALLAITTVLLQVLDSPAATAKHGPLDFDHWKTEIEKHAPSLIEVKLENDPSESFAFFFDHKLNQIVLCWYRNFEIRDPVFSRHVSSESFDVDSVYRPPIKFEITSPDGSSRWSYAEGMFLQIPNRGVKELKFYFQVQNQEGVPIQTTHFKAKKRGPKEWIVIRE